MDNFIQITVFCPPEPQVGAFVHRNVGKVYTRSLVKKKIKLSISYSFCLLNADKDFNQICFLGQWLVETPVLPNMWMRAPWWRGIMEKAFLDGDLS